MKKVLLPLAAMTLLSSVAQAGVFDSLFGSSNPKQVFLKDAKKSFTAQLKTGKIEVLTDNDDAFKAKLDAIDNAKKSIDMIYYIYSQDESADYFSSKLLAAAKRGVKVRLLLDYHSTYKHLDMFTALETASKGNIQVRFFNRPSQQVIKDAFYLTTSCGNYDLKTCRSKKKSKIDAAFKKEKIGGVSASKLNISNLDNGFSGTLISGIYSKDVDLIAYSILTGQEIDLEKLKGEGGETTAEEKQQLRELVRLYLDTKIGPKQERLAAKIKLGMASLLYGDKVNPILNMLNAYTPFGFDGSDKRTNDWDFLTDYTHHKLLIADGKQMVLGGRNIENSYHMKPNDLTDKYIFMDTDASVEIKSGGSTVVKSFEALWGFKQMTATTSDVRKHAPNEILAHKKIYGEQCASAESKMACILTNMQTDYVPVSVRELKEIKKIKEGAQDFLTKYTPTKESKAWEQKFVINDTSKMTVGYIENVPYKYGTFTGNQIRVYGRESRNGFGNVSKKAIHDIWEDSVKYTCKIATKKNPQRIIFNNAYVFPEGNMMKLLGDITDGKIKCNNVKVTILTNSVETTDLKIINQFARYSMKAFYDYYNKNRSTSKGAEVEYYEFLAPETNASGQYSLHTKLTTFGSDTVVIGSANLDIRSYMMDTNNALFINGAKDFVKEYIAHIDNMLTDKSLTVRIDDYFGSASLERLRQEDEFVIGELNKRYKIDQKIDAETFDHAKKRFLNFVQKIHTYMEEMYEIKNDSDEESQRRVKELIKELNNGYKLI